MDLMVWYCASRQVSLNIWRGKSGKSKKKKPNKPLKKSLSSHDHSRESSSVQSGGNEETDSKSNSEKGWKRRSCCAQTPLLFKNMRPHQPQRRLCSEVHLLRALEGLLEYQEQLPSPLWVFIMVQCCKITGFPQCFLLFVRLCHGNLEPVHVGDSGLSCKAPHSGIHDVSGSCAKAFLRLLSDSSTQELHCRNEEMTVGLWREREREMKNSSEVRLQDTLHQIDLTQFTRLV